MKLSKYFIPALLSPLMLVGCADYDDWNYNVEKPNTIAGYEYLNDYAPLKDNINRSSAGDFKLGAGLGESEFESGTGPLFRLAAHNFDEIVAGNAMKMVSCVNAENGEMDFGGVSTFLQSAEEAGLNVYGHTLAWHSQQPVKWLNKLLKDKELDIDPDAKIEKEIYYGDFAGKDKFPYFVMGYEPTIVNGCLHSENPGSWYQYFIADGIPVPEDGNYTAIVKVKGSKEDALTLNMGWGWGSGESASGKLKVTTEWTESKVEFTGVPGKSCNLVLQPGGYDGTLDIEIVRVVRYESPAVEVLVEDYDYSYKNEAKFPWFVMGYEPTIVNGCLHSENPGSWYQYFIADHIPHPIEGDYVATVRVKASKDDLITLNMGWGWGSGESASAKLKVTTEWTEQQVRYNGIPAKDCNLVLQPGGFDGTIDIEWVKCAHVVKMNSIPLTDEEKKDTLTWAMDRWIKGMMEACDGKVKAWDVVNEAVSGGDPDAEGVYALQSMELATRDKSDSEIAKIKEENFFWQDYLGDLDYVRTAVKLAREYGPEDIKLFVNDYNLEYEWHGNDNKKLQSLIKWIERWEADGVTKIDGIGTQTHISFQADPDKQKKQEDLIKDSFKRMAATGKLVRVSELDMGYTDANGNKVTTDKMTEAMHKQMSDFYKFIVKAYFENVPAAQRYGICQWCITDAPSSSGWRPSEPVGLWKQDYSRKHTFAGFADGLSEATGKAAQ